MGIAISRRDSYRLVTSSRDNKNSATCINLRIAHTRTHIIMYMHVYAVCNMGVIEQWPNIR